MRRLTTGSVWIVALLLGVSLASAQQATERFIPLGRSPGLSDTYTEVGAIESVDLAVRSLDFLSPAGPRTVRISERTRIWLDRSALKLTNLSGRIEHCQPGHRVEIHYEDPERREFAAWIKLEVADSDARTSRE